MGYSCPVCGSPQQDDEHLANHLAMTAMLHGEDHEAWLDDHVAEWSEHTPPELAAEVVGDAEEVDYDAATAERSVAEIPTEDAVGGEHDHAAAGDADELADSSEVPSAEFLDDAAEEAVAEARELTRERRENPADDGDDAAANDANDAAANDAAANDAAANDAAANDADDAAANDADDH